MKECPKCRACFNDDYNYCTFDSQTLAFSIHGGTVISGRYILESRLGKGGMGVVFRARHKFLKSLHAVKVILPSLVEGDKTLLVRFKQEAILAASINHQNVIRVTDFGVEDEIMPYLVMEYIDGTPLSFYLIQDKPLPLEKAYEFFLPVAQGVAEAHSKGIVHRDLKPQNIMVQNGLPLKKAIKVLDFGLAKVKSTESFGSFIQANTLSVLGSPPYMSPEQWSDGDVDHRADIYGLGIMLYQMLAGRLPFQADSVPSVMYQHLMSSPPAFETHGVAISPPIEEVVRKALQKEPADRPNSVNEMLEELNKAITDSATFNMSGMATEYLLPSSQNTKEPNTISLEKTGQLTETQKERLFSYFDSTNKPNILADTHLAQEFLQAQDRVEEAKVKANEADQLEQEFVDAQKFAEEAKKRALDAKQKIEDDIRRRVEAEMENKLASEQQARQKAEAERLAQEAEARRKAEERANQLAQTALEAQRLAERERKNWEKEVHQREHEEGVRRQAEIAAAQLAEQVANAKKKYEEAKAQAEREAEMRRLAEAKRQKIESDLQSLAESEVERRKLAEAEAKKQIQEQASRFEKEAIAAQQRVEEARWLADLEAQKREQAEAAQRRAEEEARRLAEEIAKVQKRIEEMQHQHTTADTQQLPADLSDSRQLAPPPTSDIVSQNSASNFITPTVRLQQTGKPYPTMEIQASPSRESFPSLLNANQPVEGKMPAPLLIAGIASLFLIVVVAGGYGIYSFAFKSSDKKEPPVIVKTDDASVGNTTETKKSLKERALIQGGSFQMGRSDIPNPGDLDWGNQYPAHPVTVGSFYMDKTETTNEEYAKFVKATNYPSPSYWSGKEPPAGKEKFPVTDVTAADAKVYADWVSKQENKSCRLPTEEEWEFAARNGARQTTFPWGDDWRADAAVLSGKSAVEVGASKDETAVGGIKDMLGNVSEWTSSVFALYAGHPGKLGNNKEKNISVRGLNWNMEPNLLKNPNWLITSRNGVPEAEKYPFLGFRLVCAP